MSKLINESLEERTTIVRSQDKQHIFEFTKEYAFDGAKAIVITLFSESDNTLTTFDRTKYFSFINLSSLGINKITMFSLFTRVNESFKSGDYSDDELKTSLTYLRKLLEDHYDYVIVAIGSSHSSQKNVKMMKRKLFEMLLPLSEENKVVKITDIMGLYQSSEEQTLHPLYCGNYLALRWKLIPFNVSYALQDLINSEERAIEMKKRLSGSKSKEQVN